MRILVVGALGCGVLAAGCASDPKVEPSTPRARIDLRAALGAPAVAPVGVAIAPDGGRFVFDEQLGLFQIATDGSGVSVMPMSALPDPGVPLTLPFTDLTAIAPGMFALTAIGEGFVLDTSAMTLQQRFCYVPTGMPTDVQQRTDAIAYDPTLDRLYAQPVATDAQGAVQYAMFASYDRATGSSLEWLGVAQDVAATGMTVIPGRGLVLGQGSRLDLLDQTTGLSSPLDDLARFGIESIDGLAVDPAAQTLEVVDRVAGELVELDLAQLAR